MTNPVDLILYKPIKAIWDTQANPGPISLTATQREFYTQALQQLDAMAPELANSPVPTRFYVNLEGTGDDYSDSTKVSANPALLYKDQIDALKTAPPGTPTPVIEPGIGTRLADNNLLTNFVDAALAITAIPHVLQALQNLATQVKTVQDTNKRAGDYSPITPTIVITGFSRGAAEARILMNILDTYGIPDPLDPVFDVLQPTNTNLPDQRLTYADLHFGTNSATPALVPPYSTTGTTNIPVYAILFDTVATNMENNPFTIPSNVQKIVQFASLDERRHYFPLTSLFPTTSIAPTLSNIWDYTTATNNSTKLVEVALPGVHADIGGGYSGNNVSSATAHEGLPKLGQGSSRKDTEPSSGPSSTT